MTELLKSTVAYRILKGDKKNGKLSHAYGFVCDDSYALGKYLEIAAKLIMCRDEEFCDKCRTCRMIDSRSHWDVIFYPDPLSGGKIKADAVDDLIEKAHKKPVESDRHVFVISAVSAMNETAQNKLLKTLEEPPENVYILLGIDNENAVLPTVKSRVKKLTAPLFSATELTKGLKDICPDGEKLKTAVSFAEGRLGRAIDYYKAFFTADISGLVNDILKNMNSSREVINFAKKIDKENIREFLICLKKTMFDIMRAGISVPSDTEEQYAGTAGSSVGELKEVYGTACCAAAIERISGAERGLAFNANATMTAESILLGILEERHRWKKL